MDAFSGASDNSATSHTARDSGTMFGNINRSALENDFQYLFRLRCLLARYPQSVCKSAFDCPLARAKWRVGEAAVVKNEVLVLRPSTIQIKVGDGVVRDETVRTGNESATRLVMAHSTELHHRVQRITQVYAHCFRRRDYYREVVVRMTSGVFSLRHRRIRSKAPYKITMLLATIGVRGTTLDILSQRGQTIVNLQDGAASVSHDQFPRIQLTQPGDSRHHHRGGGGGRSTIKKTNNLPWTFAATAAPWQGFAARRNMPDAVPVTIDDGATPNGMPCGR